MKQRQKISERTYLHSIEQRQRNLGCFCRRQFKQSINLSLEYVRLVSNQDILGDFNGLLHVSRPSLSAHCTSRAPKSGKDDRTYALVAIKESVADLLLRLQPLRHL
jgi:hypothetical protein